MAKTQLEPVSLADLKKRWEFQALIPAHQVFVDALLQFRETTGRYDFLAATALAYPGSALKPDSLAVRSSQLQAHKNVRRCLDLAFGRPQTEDADVLVTLRIALKKSIRKDMVERGVLSDATARALAIWERKTGKTIHVGKAQKVTTDGR